MDAVGDGGFRYEVTDRTTSGASEAILVYACSEPSVRALVHLLVPDLGDNQDYLVASGTNHCFKSTRRADKEFGEQLLMYMLHKKTGCGFRFGSANAFHVFDTPMWVRAGGKAKDGRAFKGLTLPSSPPRKRVARSDRTSFDAMPANDPDAVKSVNIVKHVPAPSAVPDAIAPLVEGLRAAALVMGVKLQYGLKPALIAPTFIERAEALRVLRTLRATWPDPNGKVAAFIKEGESRLVRIAVGVVEAVATGADDRTKAEVQHAIEGLRSDWAMGHVMPAGLPALFAAAEGKLDALQVRRLRRLLLAPALPTSPAHPRARPSDAAHSTRTLRRRQYYRHPGDVMHPIERRAHLTWHPVR